MRFERLRLAGFKSFVEPVELAIGEGLTGVVGPNGCGKSNLLEALRWAMGEGSARSLRGGGMDDVIFAGTTGRPARDFAEVTLVLDNPGGALPGALGHGERVEVTRRIERGAGSAYRLNGRDVRQKDVALLFADAATGAHSPALVSQGRISAIIAAKPQERRLLLEEAAGNSGLHARRKDAEQRLRATALNLERLDDLLGQMEGQATALRRQARAAERYRRLSERIRIAEAELIFARWRDAAAAADWAEAEARAADAAVTQWSEAHRQTAEAQETAARRLAALRVAEAEARDALARAKAEAQALAGERSRHAARVRELETAARTLERDRAREGALAADAASAIARLEAEGTALDARIRTNRASLAALGPRLDEVEAATVRAEQAQAEAVERQAAAQAEARVADAAVRAAEDGHRRTAADLARLESEAERLGRDAPDPEAVATAQAALAMVETAIEAAAVAIARAEAERDAAETGREAARAAEAEASAALKALESERAVVARMATLPDAARATALGQLRVAPGYERALAAALGDDLDAAIADPNAVRSWQGADLAGDPPLPAGVEPLSGHVGAPPELARRLAQIGVVDADDGGIALLLGQRLVTREGRLRRWDGFVASGSGRAAAERLIQANRLVALDAALPAARQALADAAAAASAAQARHAAARADEAAARAALTEAERRRRTAETELAARRAMAERHAARLAAALAARTAAAETHRGSEEALAAARVARAALPPLDGPAEEVAAARRQAESIRATLAALRADHGQQRRQIDSDSDRLVAVRREVEGWRVRSADAAARAAELAERDAALAGERALLAEAPADFERRGADIETRSQVAGAAATAAAEALRMGEAELAEADRLLASVAESLAAAREDRAGAAARAEAQVQRRIEAGRLSGERFECPPPLLPERLGFEAAAVGPTPEVAARFEALTQERERMGPVNLVAERELAELEARRTTGQAEHAELTEAIQRLRGSIGSLNREGRARLLAAFEAVDGHFRTLFTTLFQGGQARLELIESDDPLEAGLEILAQPPGKKLASLTLLSGGEQALTAVALIFALFLTNPAPICVLDEVDAPLDDANVERFCDLLDRMVGETETRFLIVTHNPVTMSRMHRLFGVTMIERGVSRLVSVDLQAAESLLTLD